MIMDIKKPEWLRIKYRQNSEIEQVVSLLNRLALHTVCQEAKCPNLLECFAKKTATFMILGKNCTRNCTFCNVHKGEPEPVNIQEAEHIVEAVQELGLSYVVITSVTRDDLPDGGASQFIKVIRELHQCYPELLIEVLIPDFAGNQEALTGVVEARPEVLNHNVETVPRLYPEVRPLADYQRSLLVLKKAKEINPKMITKSGIMVGLGEKEEEVIQVFHDLRAVDCDMLTIGQYLAPSPLHHSMVEYVHPEKFAFYQKKAYQLGFKGVASAPLVRSSHGARELYLTSY
jgi:lipoic acid synthetase